MPKLKGHVMGNTLGEYNNSSGSTAYFCCYRDRAQTDKSISYFWLHKRLGLEEAAWELPRQKECKDVHNSEKLLNLC